MPKSTDVAALEGVRTGSLRKKFNRRCFALFQLPTLLRRSEYQPRRTIRICAVGNRKNGETMVVVNRRDLEFNFRSPLHMNRRGRILILLSCNLYDCGADLG